MSTREIVAGSPKLRSAQSHLRVLLATLLLILLVAGTIMFREVGRWLVREDPLERSDVIVILSGSMPVRAEEAAKVFQMGYAPEVWVSRPESAAAELSAMGIAYAGEESYNRDVLVHLGVPATAIRIFPEAIVDTEEEIEEVLQQMSALHKQSVIIVTSPPHTRRVRTLWQKLSDHQPTLKLTVHGAWQDSFDVDHWWRTTHDTSAVERETMGLLNAWMGLPVRPRSALKLNSL
jgi:uncharacterized SAM-binding protein YcdF (DUF218 family)